MTEIGLFPEPPRAGGVPAPDERTPGQRRRDRQLVAIISGEHPLSVALGAALPLHPDARRDGDRVDDGSPRCGGCAHRSAVFGGARSYPKCLFGAHESSRRRYSWEKATERHVRPDGRVPITVIPRDTRGPGTDVAAWWPACHNYSPADAPTEGDTQQ